jgi:hypothetical protein
MFAVPSIAVFCSESIECFPGIILIIIIIIIIIISLLYGALVNYFNTLSSAAGA